MTKRPRRAFSAESRLEAAKTMDVGKSTMERFFRSLKIEWLPVSGYRKFSEATENITRDTSQAIRANSVTSI